MLKQTAIKWCVAGFLGLVTGPGLALAQDAAPAWLKPHIGLADGQIAPLVLQRARQLYQKNLKRGAISNPCYLAMDATRPSATSSGDTSRRFYLICEGQQVFKAMSSGYGNGRKIPGADFSNGRQCARNFSNAEGSNLTTGGSYLTSEVRTSYKGYFSDNGKIKPFVRPFLAFDGLGDTKNARQRFIGGHQATFLRTQCLLKRPGSKYANDDGYVRFGRLIDYTSGRSNGCTTWSAASTAEVLRRVEKNPTTLYIYPESTDIKAVARAVGRGKSPTSQGLYWNKTCLAAIGQPQFWPKRKLEPMIKRWRASLPKTPGKELPICN